MEARTAWRRVLAGAVLTGVLSACAPGAAQPSRSASTLVAPPPTITETTRTETTPTEATGVTTTPPVRLAEPFDPDAVLARITALTAFGPRDATSRAHARAAAYVAAELERLGYEVSLQDVPVPAGTSWGIRVPAGTSSNVIGEPEGFDAARPHVVIGAHLDTVPQAPGAEDNASGVALLLELARMLHEQPAKLPVRLVAFGAEESRGAGSSRYAFGSRHYVAELGVGGRAAVTAMVSLDRVGVRAATVPVCFGDRDTRRLSDTVRAASPSVPTTACRNRASDHVSFEAVGIPAARIGSVPYPAYHSERDVPTVIDRRQLARSGAVVWSWLRSLD